MLVSKGHSLRILTVLYLLFYYVHSWSEINKIFIHLELVAEDE